MTALRKIGAVLLLPVTVGGVVATNGANGFEAQAQVTSPIRHTVLYHSESVLGKELIASGKNAGRIVDVLTDGSGRVRAVVVDYGGFLGLGSRKIAVAWSDLRFAPGGSDAVTTDISVDRLSAAPEVRAGKPVVVIGGSGYAPENGITQN
ncbi:MAG TPA: PRC-barrel domain-containing protein [Rhodomicrobium sp.]|nr:PRC-barrel domain-containing protein [Rhodomicrobium sp.]